MLKARNESTETRELHPAFVPFASFAVNSPARIRYSIFAILRSTPPVPGKSRQSPPPPLPSLAPPRIVRHLPSMDNSRSEGAADRRNEGPQGPARPAALAPFSIPESLTAPPCSRLEAYGLQLLFPPTPANFHHSSATNLPAPQSSCILPAWKDGKERRSGGAKGAARTRPSAPLSLRRFAALCLRAFLRPSVPALLPPIILRRPKSTSPKPTPQSCSS